MEFAGCKLTIGGVEFASIIDFKTEPLPVKPSPPPTFSGSATCTMKRRSWLRFLHCLPKKRNMLFRGRAGEAFRRRQEVRRLVHAAVHAAALRFLAT